MIPSFGSLLQTVGKKADEIEVFAMVVQISATEGGWRAVKEYDFQ